jgi:large subunit ribosomal protein LX
MVKVFRLKGSFGEKGRNQVFTMDVVAPTEAKATEKVYTDIGSKHKVKRRFVVISSVEAVKAADSKSLLVRQLGKGE